MKFRLIVDVDAVQFVGNHAEVADFLTTHTGVEHLSHWQDGVERPMRLWSNGFDLIVHPSQWLVAFGSGVQVVDDADFKASFRAQPAH